MTAGGTATVVVSGAVDRQSHSLPVVVAAAKHRSLLLHLDEALDPEFITVGDGASLVVDGRPFTTDIEGFDGTWLTLGQPPGLTVDDPRVVSRVATPSLPLRLTLGNRQMTAHIIDLSPRGARLILENVETLQVGMEFSVEFGGTHGVGVVRRVNLPPSPRLQDLGVEFVERTPEMVIELIHSVGAASVPDLPS